MDAISKRIDDNLVIYDRHEKPTEAIKRHWDNCAAFFVCGGPSTNAVDYLKLGERGVLSLGLNNVAGKVPVSAFTFNDPPEKFHHGIWRDGKIMKFLPRPKLCHRGRGTTREKLPDGSFKYLDRKTPDYPNVWGYDRSDYFVPEEFLTSPGASFGNNNKGVLKTGRPKIICSMFLGLRLLHYLGVRRVYLLGVDFNMDASAALTGNYSFGETRTRPQDLSAAENKDGKASAVESNNNIYATAAPMLDELRPVFEAAGFGVFNCNPMSRLRAFDYVPFEDALDDCRNGVPSGDFDLAGWYVKGERNAS